MAINPIKFTEGVVDDFLRYQLTTYPFSDVDLYRQMKELLRLDETRATPLRKGPFISLSRQFQSGATIDELVSEGLFHPGMREIVAYPSVRSHQELAFRSISEGRTTLVSTGTGSGKTEAFLYPIISRCLELKSAGAPPGVVAVLVYPMNALATDQLDRLRGLLAGWGIPFGMYVGKTPESDDEVIAERMPAGATNASFVARLKKIREEGESGTLIPHEERASRKAMREDGGQPRILLTNVKQLELLLTRGKDVGIFKDAPLEFLVFDEAHTFRGAQGAETACLIRRLRTFCGRRADQVKHIATSATMASKSKGLDASNFARRFFGVDPDRVTLIHEKYDELRWNEIRQVPVGPGERASSVLMEILEAVDSDSDKVAVRLSKQLVELGGAKLPSNDWQGALRAQLVGNELVFQLAQLLSTPQPLPALAEKVGIAVGRHVSEEEVLAWLALGAATGRDAQEPVLRPVVHTFVKGVGGGVVTFDRPGKTARLWLSGEDAQSELGDEIKRFPVITCTTCGQHYYETHVEDFGLPFGGTSGPTGGRMEGSKRKWPAVPGDSNGGRVLFVDRLVLGAEEDEEVDDFDEDGRPIDSLRTPVNSRLSPLFVCSRCGSIQEDKTDSCLCCHADDSLIPVQAVRMKPDFEGLLHSCVACQAPAKRPGGGRYREPARPVRAVSVSDVHVLAQSMIHRSERQRLLVFADNRQDAAFQAGWMQDHSRRFRLRTMIAQNIPAEGIGVTDLVHALNDIFEDNSEMSRALLPEVWKAVPAGDGSVRQRAERLRFLQIQVLRELSMGVKQRLGLEPWGRLKVKYKGLGPDSSFVRAWASKLACQPADILDGVEAVLDLMRRRRLINDKIGVFTRFWSLGDRVVQFGYLPPVPGGPKGLKLTRDEGDDKGRVLQWVGDRPTQMWNVVAAWGIPEDQIEGFLKGLWNELIDRKILKKVVLENFRGPLKGCNGVYQIDSNSLILQSHSGRYRCQKCRRTTVRKGVNDVCMSWRCGGRLLWEAEDLEDFDLRMLDGNYAMVRAAEHSAQVPNDERERIENQFKGAGEQVNTLVCTPTLELGVDIGALDAVLMRNVPPTAANYWQRAGRAGRRHRMAVDVTYAQTTGFDQAYFRDPLKLLNGQVEPPRFNLKNSVMVRKHVHAAVLTALHGIARCSDAETARRIEEVISESFPVLLRPYLFDAGGRYLNSPRTFEPLSELIFEYLDDIMDSIRTAFVDAWPDEDASAVDVDGLKSMVVTMPVKLAEVVARFKRRLDWARGEVDRLYREKQLKGTLDDEDKAHEKRCDKVIARFKGTAHRGRGQAQGGADDSETMGALAREGFLPGYGLEAGSIVGLAEASRDQSGVGDFELARAPTMALREYVPGNAIYANGQRFVPRRFTLTPDEVMRFDVIPEKQAVHEAGVDQSAAPLGKQELRAIPVCDVVLTAQSQISDEEEFRFQMPVAVFAVERDEHGGGTRWKWGELDIRFRRAVQLRLVNVGVLKDVDQARLGYPICLACGQSISPFASKKAREKFVNDHKIRCGHDVMPTGVFADVEVDVLSFVNVPDRQFGLSLAEAVRMGAAGILDMEVEDLQILVVGKSDCDECDVLLYDPMPGGSGLLENLAARWQEVVAAALDLVNGCPGACDSSCIDCLQTFRNRFYHKYLDRHVAAEVLASSTGPLVGVGPIPECRKTTITTAGQPQTVIEKRFKRYLKEADMPPPECQKKIDLGPGWGTTTPDFFYEVPDEKGLCVYLDGMAGHIHGNPDQSAKDKFLRDRLDSLGYSVIAVTSTQLDDPQAVAHKIYQIAKELTGKEKAKALKNDLGWFDRAREEINE